MRKDLEYLTSQVNGSNTFFIFAGENGDMWEFYDCSDFCEDEAEYEQWHADTVKNVLEGLLDDELELIAGTKEEE